MFRRPCWWGIRSNLPPGRSRRRSSASFRSCGEPAGRWPTATCLRTSRHAACESKCASSACLTGPPRVPESAPAAAANAVMHAHAITGARVRAVTREVLLILGAHRRIPGSGIICALPLCPVRRWATGVPLESEAAMTLRSTDPFRREQIGLLRRIEELPVLAHELPSMGVDQRISAVERVVAFLAQTLLPHAQIEQQI